MKEISFQIRIMEFLRKNLMIFPILSSQLIYKDLLKIYIFGNDIHRSL